MGTNLHIYANIDKIVIYRRNVNRMKMRAIVHIYEVSDCVMCMCVSEVERLFLTLRSYCDDREVLI